LPVKTAKTLLLVKTVLHVAKTAVEEVHEVVRGCGGEVYGYRVDCGNMSGQCCTVKHGILDSTTSASEKARKGTYTHKHSLMINNKMFSWEND
jgi:hypothetical protein